MAIIRERDYWQAKRKIADLSIHFQMLDLEIDKAPSECKYEEWAVTANEIEYLKSVVAEHDGESVRPSDMERPSTESSLSQSMTV